MTFFQSVHCGPGLQDCFIVLSQIHRGLGRFGQPAVVLRPQRNGRQSDGSSVTPQSRCLILILPVFIRSVSAKRILAAGAVAGMAALVRYDTGIALFGAQASVVAIAIYLRVNGIKDGLRNFVSTFWPYLIGFAAVTLPALSYYLARAPIYDFVHDIFIYPSKYYYRGRNLPFPGIHIKDLINSGFILLLRSFAFRFILQ